MKKINAIILFALVVLLGACSTKEKQLRREIAYEISALQNQLPLQVPNLPMYITSIRVDGDLLEYVATMPSSLFGDQTLNEEMANSDKNIARVLSSLNEKQVGMFTKAGLGIRFIYRSSDTGEDLLTVEATCETLKRVVAGVASGEIEPYSCLDIFQMEMDGYDFPCEVDEGVWMTDGFISGNTVCYICRIDAEITSDDLSYSEVLEMKRGIQEGIKESLVVTHKKEMQQKGIRIVYIYKNINDVEFARVEITADDL